MGCDIAVIFKEGFEVLLMGRVGRMLTRESGDEGWILENRLQIDGSLPPLVYLRYESRILNIEGSHDLSRTASGNQPSSTVGGLGKGSLT